MSRATLLYAATAGLAAALFCGVSFVGTMALFWSQSKPGVEDEKCRGEINVTAIAAMVQQATSAIHFLVVAADLVMKSEDVGSIATDSDPVKPSPRSGLEMSDCWAIAMCMSAMSGGLGGLVTMPECHFTRLYTTWIMLWTMPGLLVISGSVVFIAAVLVMGGGMLCLKCAEVGTMYVSAWRRAGNGFELAGTTF